MRRFSRGMLMIGLALSGAVQADYAIVVRTSRLFYAPSLAEPVDAGTIFTVQDRTAEWCTVESVGEASIRRGRINTADLRIFSGALPDAEQAFVAAADALALLDMPNALFLAQIARSRRDGSPVFANFHGVLARLSQCARRVQETSAHLQAIETQTRRQEELLKEKKALKKTAVLVSDTEIDLLERSLTEARRKAAEVEQARGREVEDYARAFDGLTRLLSQAMLDGFPDAAEALIRAIDAVRVAVSDRDLQQRLRLVDTRQPAAKIKALRRALDKVQKAADRNQVQGALTELDAAVRLLPTARVVAEWREKLAALIEQANQMAAEVELLRKEGRYEDAYVQTMEGLALCGDHQRLNLLKTGLREQMRTSSRRIKEETP